MTKQQATQKAQDGRESPGPRPVHEIRLGRIKAAIWANETDGGVRHSTTISRLYKDGEGGEWKSTQSFHRDDLLLVAEVARQAAASIYPTSQNEEVTF